MDDAGQLALSRAGLAEQQDGRVGGRHLVHAMENRLQGVAVADDGIGVGLHPDGGPTTAVVW
jgi:hypothetical protein